VAFWGDENAMTLLNAKGKVFAVQTMDMDANELPRLEGPVGSEQDLWWMYQQLEPMFGALSLNLDFLEERAQGGWKAGLRGGAEIEIGTGDLPQLVAQVGQFVKTLGYVAAQYRRSPAALEFADLRYNNGYALRLQGVTTTSALPVKRSGGKSG
jgi:cell division protein FtsQ